MSRRILVNFAHPVLERSRVNRRLVAAIRGVPGVTVHDLYEAYPTLRVDAAAEQRRLLEHDVVVFQHPFFWYSTPALLKEWQDQVLAHGWAYGTGGRALVGRITLNALTTGGPATTYRREGRNRFTIRELLTPYEATANLCGMRFLAPFTVHGALRLSTDEDVAPFARAYRRLLEALRDERVDLDAATRVENLYDALDQVAP